MFPRSAKSPRKSIQGKPSKLAFAVASCALVVTAAVSSVAVASSASASAARPRSAAPNVAVAAARPALAGFSAALAPAGRATHGDRASVGTRPATTRPATTRPATTRPATTRPPRPRQRPCHANSPGSWICRAESDMVAHGTPRSLVSVGAGYIVVMHESGGNPRAYNGWDSNAAAGTPSEGIAQVIEPTFAAYHLPGHDNIWNPVDNMIAAFRYAISRYGSMNSIPGVVAVRSGGSYVGY